MVKINKNKSNYQKEFKSKIQKISKVKTKLGKATEVKKIKKATEGIANKIIEPSNLKPEKLTKIQRENILKALNGVLKFHSDNPKLKNQLFEEQFPIFLQISCFKVPKGYSKIYRIPLKHSLYNTESEVCLIVSEIKGIKNAEHDQHKEHYEKLLSDKGISNIKNIMTFHEFRTEYETFEQKNRLVDLFDVFLADSKISGKVVNKCGKIFYTKRKVPTSVKMQMTKLKEHIDKILSKTFLHMHLKGNCYTVQVGHSKMTLTELQENFQSITQFLEKDFPGGMANIMGIQIFAPRVPSIPVYFSSESGKDIEVPKISTKKPKAFKTYRGELTTLPNAEVVVKPSGKVIVKKIREIDDETDTINMKNESFKKSKSKDNKKIVDTKQSSSESEAIEIKKPKKSKRKIEKVSETSQNESSEKSNIKKKIILTIESGKIEDEAISGELTSGNQIKKEKTKNKATAHLKLNKSKKIDRSAKGDGNKKKDKTQIKKIKAVKNVSLL